MDSSKKLINEYEHIYENDINQLSSNLNQAKTEVKYLNDRLNEAHRSLNQSNVKFKIKKCFF